MTKIFVLFLCWLQKMNEKLFKEDSSLKTMINFLDSTGGKIFRWHVLSYQLSLISHYFCCIHKYLLGCPHLGRTLWGENIGEFTFHFLMLPKCHTSIWIAVKATGLCEDSLSQTVMLRERGKSGCPNSHGLYMCECGGRKNPFFIYCGP